MKDFFFCKMAINEIFIAAIKSKLAICEFKHNIFALATRPAHSVWMHTDGKTAW